MLEYHSDIHVNRMANQFKGLLSVYVSPRPALQIFEIYRRNAMKKTLLSIFVLGMVAVFVPSAEASTATTTSLTETAQFWEGQPRRGTWNRRDDRRNRRDGRWDRRNDRNRGRRDNNRNYNRVRYETITVRRGNKLYRETYRISWDNGRMKRKRVDRVRIR